MPEEGPAAFEASIAPVLRSGSAVGSAALGRSAHAGPDGAGRDQAVVLLAREELRRGCPPGDHALSIGVFDGVHTGHRMLIERLIAEAQRRGLRAGVVTFHPSPITVLRPEIALNYLESLEQRVELLRGLGVDFVTVVDFTSELAQVSAEDFARILAEDAGMRLLVVGEDFALGRGRKGTVGRLGELGVGLGFEVMAVPLLAQSDDAVSSTRVRRALGEGEMETVTRLLGRPYTLRGPVLHGDERGRELGYPTLNVGVSADRLLPRDGVYAARALLRDGRAFQACVSIGTQPTFDGEERRVEAYLLDFDEEIYGHVVSVQLLCRLSGQEKFESVEALVAKIARDVAAAGAYFADGGRA